MRWTPLGLLVAGLLAVPAAAADSPVGPNSAAIVGPDAVLLSLDQKLASTQEIRRKGRISPEDYEAFLARFRADLAGALAGASPAPENTALHARILARLGEFQRAGDALGAALKQNPDNAALRTALSQIRFDEKNYPAALAEANAALERDPANREALALKHFSEGRVAMNGAAADDRSPSFLPSPTRRFHFAAADPAKLPFKLAVKIAPAAAPPDLIARGSAPAAPAPLPLLPMAEAAALCLAAYEISRSRAAYESTDGLDDEHPKPVGLYQRLVAGAILAGAAGAVIYTLGAAAVSAAPLALSYATNIGSHGLRLANAEAGAINPDTAEKAVEAAPLAEAAAVETEQIVLQKGEILNRVWHSEWKPNSTLSGPEGFSYCRGACLPLHAVHAIEGRGLSIGVVNNAREGGLYRVTEDVIVTIRQSVGGYEQEILFRTPEDLKKLEPIRDSVSSIPPGP